MGWQIKSNSSEKERSVQVNLSLCLIKYYAMKTHGGMEVQLHQMEESGHLHGLTALSPGKSSPVPIG
jgi:hypothetical protein